MIHAWAHGEEGTVQVHPEAQQQLQLQQGFVQMAKGSGVVQKQGLAAVAVMAS
jgi:hypothetical protein